MEQKKGIVDISDLNTPPTKHELKSSKLFCCHGKECQIHPAQQYS